MKISVNNYCIPWTIIITPKLCGQFGQAKHNDITSTTHIIDSSDLANLYYDIQLQLSALNCHKRLQL